LLVDSVEIIEFGKSGLGEKGLVMGGSGDSFGDFFEAYLPGKRIMPRPMIIEAAAQTAAFVVAGKGLLEEENDGPAGPPAVGYLVKIGGFSFSGDAREGDTLRLHVVLDSVFGALHRFSVAAEAGGAEIARGDLTFSVERAEGSG
jgi:3-hydroxymyristoyl/3-hydroxydecanoyl-(acyl carrier protein) dehydratase